ncbi:putative addiction module antidote protein [Marinifilum sp. JC120]|nr:putative addiction module antidote protein [Marinifilum sp. JC120]
MAKTKPFEAYEHLNNEEVIAEYLNAALESGNQDVLLMAVGNIAKARGMSQLAKDSGLGRESLYKALSPGSQPRYSTIMKVLGALGVSLRVQPKDTSVQ